MRHRSSVLAALLACAAADEIPFDGLIRMSADGSRYAFLPPPFESNHASFLEVTSAGLVCAWFSGAGEGANDTSIVVSVLKSGADSWAAATVVAQHAGYSCQNPVLWQQPGGLLYLWHTCQPAHIPPVEDGAQLFQKSSPDGGLTWSQGDGSWWTLPGAFDRNRVFQHDNGTVTLPAYNASGSDADNYSIRISSSVGVPPGLPLPPPSAWREVPLPGTAYRVQPSWVRLGGQGGSTVVSFFRDRQSQNIYRALSTDGGFTWPAPSRTCLPNNNAALQAIGLVSGAIAMVFNNATTVRFPLVLALSYDSGVTWPYARALQWREDNATAASGPLPLGNATEWSYPTLIQTQDTGLIHVAHTYNRWTIKYHAVTEGWVRAGSTAGGLCAT